MDILSMSLLTFTNPGVHTHCKNPATLLKAVLLLAALALHAALLQGIALMTEYKADRFVCQ